VSGGPVIGATRPGGAARHGLDAFLVVWLVVQVALPLVAGLDLSEGRYFAGPFSWSMFSHRRLRAEVALYVEDAQGARRPVKDRGRLDRGLPGASLEPGGFGFYEKEGGSEVRLRALVDHLAATRRDGCLYGAEILWQRTRDPAWPRYWHYEARAEAPGAEATP